MLRQFKPLIVLIALVIGAILWSGHGNVGSDPAAGTQPVSQALPAFVPVQARHTLALIAAGGPFEHSQDGVIFGNYEGRLPARPRGYYHEYTVDTPDAHNRGARRIITGGTPAAVFYYTGDHYRTFQTFEVRQ